MPNKLEEILSQLITKSQSQLSNQTLGQLSNRRIKLLKLLDKVEVFSRKYVKQSWIQSIAFKVGIPHMKKTVTTQMTEDEIKEFLTFVYELIKDDFQDVSIAKDLNDDLNKEFNEKLKQMPKYKELANLL